MDNLSLVLDNITLIRVVAGFLAAVVFLIILSRVLSGE
jgi:hypothetical protein